MHAMYTLAIQWWTTQTVGCLAEEPHATSQQTSLSVRENSAAFWLGILLTAWHVNLCNSPSMCTGVQYNTRFDFLPFFRFRVIIILNENPKQ